MDEEEEPQERPRIVRIVVDEEEEPQERPRIVRIVVDEEEEPQERPRIVRIIAAEDELQEPPRMRFLREPRRTPSGPSVRWAADASIPGRHVNMLDNFPEELRNLPQWIGWKRVPSRTRPGKTDKIPVDPHSGDNASTTNPATWGTFDEAVAAAKRYELAGVGFVFTENDPYTGVDLDHCIDEAGEAAPWALAYIGRLDSYTELSQSKTGLHVIVRATLPPGGRKKGPIEMYDSGRFFVVTGDVYLGYRLLGERQAAIEELHAEVFGVPEPVQQMPRPAQPVTLADADLIAKAQGARNGGKFTALVERQRDGLSFAVRGRSGAGRHRCCSGRAAMWAVLTRFFARARYSGTSGTNGTTQTARPTVRPHLKRLYPA